MNHVNLSVADARALLEASMVAVGHTAAEADIIADHLIDCELRGLSFGGLPRALSIIENIRALEAPRRAITVLHETPVSVSIDGGENVGYLVGRRATDLAIAKAQASGIAVVGAAKTWYTGMYSYYLEKVTQAGLVGMIAGSGRAKVAPYGGSEARFCTNPIAFGFPSSKVPVIWDIGTSNQMMAEVTLAQRLGEQLAPDMAFDKDGEPTRDPTAALVGAITVWGGHKGSGLAMVIQLLGMLAGQAAAPKTLNDCGFFIVVIDPALLGSADDFRRRVADFADSLRATRPIDPAKPVRVPFERSIAERERRKAADVIEVATPILEALRREAGQV